MVDMKTPEQLRKWRHDWEIVNAGVVITPNDVIYHSCPRWLLPKKEKQIELENQMYEWEMQRIRDEERRRSLTKELPDTNKKKWYQIW